MLKKTLLIGLLVAACLGGFDLYTRTPLDAPADSLMPALPAGVRTLVLVVHGSADSDNPQFPAIVKRLEDHYAAAGESDVAVRFLNWSPWSDQRLRAGATAERLGTLLGEKFASADRLERLQLVVHSSGAYVADALCESYRGNAVNPARVTEVFLDPFQLHGLFDFAHGARNHGRCADFALAVLNTEDPAPSTDAFLAQAWNIDVTAHPGRASLARNGHYWPVQYYLEYLPGLESPPLALDHTRYPRGGVVTDPP